MRFIFKIIKKIGKFLAWVVLLTLLIPLTGGIYVFSGLFECCHVAYQETKTQSHLPDANIALAGKAKAAIKTYHRPVESTFLTFPEWYIVYSSQDYAKVLKINLPSDFPYFGEIGQFWQGYCYVNALSKKYPFNLENHIMIMVIGTSLTLEYIVKGVYENTIGRFSEWTSNHQQVEEDKYAYKVANDYATLIPVRPWYEFTFLNSFKNLWKETSLWGKNAFRKWERKIILSIEYSFKAFYAWAIEKSTHAAFGVAEVNTMAWVNRLSANLLKNGNIKTLDQLASSEIVSIPRYQPFTAATIEAIDSGTQFYDIAGNAIIMLSAVVPVEAKISEGTVVFTLPVLTDRKLKRIAIVTQVVNLHQVIKSLQRINARTEHIYDY
ncbi:MAG: hypothetical protein AB7I18_04270 [Candidatus Berkiella sp.]